MNTFVLILMMHVGAFAKGNSNSLTTAEFSSKEACEIAGNEAKKMANDTVKEIKFVCVKK